MSTKESGSREVAQHTEREEQERLVVILGIDQENGQAVIRV